jgi:tight adherence protein C
MVIAALTFAAAFLILSLAGFAIFREPVAARRLARVVAPPADVNALLRAPVVKRDARLALLIEPFQRILPRSSVDVSILLKRLVRAGYREKTYINIFYGAKVLVPAALCIAITVTGLWEYIGFFSYVMALGLGFLVPDFWLGNRIKKRQTNIRLGLPDALDLIIICVEAGLGMDRAIQRTTDELRLSQPEIADELALVSLEQRAGRSRPDAWKNFADRTGVDSVRALASILIQADRFGTSVGKTLRAHADTLRTRRRQDAEEMAAKTTVKLIFPLVVFIFPALFVVTLGPSVVNIMTRMEEMFK